MMKTKPKLNEQKFEVLLCGPPSRRESVPVDGLSVGEASIPFSSVVKPSWSNLLWTLLFLSINMFHLLPGPDSSMSDLGAKSVHT